MSPIFRRMSGMHLTFFGLPSGFADTPLTQRGLPLLTLDKFSVLLILPLCLLWLFVFSERFCIVYHVALLVMLLHATFRCCRRSGQPVCNKVFASDEGFQRGIVFLEFFQGVSVPAQQIYKAAKIAAVNSYGINWN